MSRGLFITGTDTGVGKTYVTALIARRLLADGHRVGVYKPVASGCSVVHGEIVSDDAVALWEAAGRPHTLDAVCPQRFIAPLAPPVAAREEGRNVDAQQLRGGIQSWRQCSDIVLVEGAGGLMSPVSDRDFTADLAADFGYPLVIVTANRLGTINATLQTLIAAQHWRCGLPVAGIVFNTPSISCDDPSTASNFHELSSRTPAPILAEVQFGRGYDRQVDWWELSACKQNFQHSTSKL
jgi:dethiobiotin synthetase